MRPGHGTGDGPALAHLTRRSDYALRALVELAVQARTSTATVTAEEIAERQGLPLAYLFRILGTLRSIGLVESRRGQGGGYLLARKAGQIVVSEVIRAAEELPAPVDLRPGTDVSSASAAVQDLWSTIDKQVGAVLDQVTVADLAAGRPDRPC